MMFFLPEALVWRAGHLERSQVSGLLVLSVPVAVPSRGATIPLLCSTSKDEPYSDWVSILIRTLQGK